MAMFNSKLLVYQRVLLQPNITLWQLHGLLEKPPYIDDVQARNLHV